jgi:hypothetical protein
MKKKIKFNILIIFFCFSKIIFGQTKNDSLVFGLKNSILYKESTFKGYEHIEIYKPKNIKSVLKPEFRIKYESQTAITIRAKINGTKYFNIPICTLDSYLIDEEFGKFINNCFIQIGEHDFNNDGIAEIIIAFGVRGKYLECSIYQYYEPANIKDSDREENWSKISDFRELGNYNIKNFPEVRGNKIYFPYGSRGLGTSFLYNDRSFIEID